MAINTDFFDIIDTEEKAYWLGFIYADGHLSPSQPRRGAVMTINLQVSDVSHLKRLADIFGRDIIYGHTKSYGNKRYPYARLNVCSNRVVRSIVSHGIPYKKTLNNDVTVFDHIPEELKHHFIRGVFDGDGNIHSRKGREDSIFSICGAERFIEDLQEYMCSILGLSKTKLARREGGFTKVVWGGKHQPLRIRDWLYADATVYMQRKWEIFADVSSKRFSYRASPYRGVSMSHSGKRWEVNISVNRNLLYLGTFDTPEKAALAYDDAARKYRGDMAIVNFPKLLTIEGGESKDYPRGK